VDPDARSIAGRNTIRFKMLADDTRIQLDLAAKSGRGTAVHAWAQPALAYPARSRHGLRWTSPPRLRAGEEGTRHRLFHYSGHPQDHRARFGRTGRSAKDYSPGHHWITTGPAKERGPPACVWSPIRIQWRDDSQSGMDISVARSRNGLIRTCPNGRFMGKDRSRRGYTRGTGRFSIPINNYSVALNIGRYEHFADTLGNLPLEFYVLPRTRTRRRKQFAQAKPMLDGLSQLLRRVSISRRTASS
jgi:hypothetical protein